MTRLRTSRRHLSSSPRRQDGQALTEMAILAVVLVPLFLLIPMLGRYTHLQQVSQQAARGAAWEATVVQDYEMSGPDVRQEMMVNRYFNAADAPITSTLPEPIAEDTQVGDAMFNTFSDRPLIEHDDPQLQPYEFKMHAGMMAEVTSYIPEWLPGEFPPSDNGLVTVELVVRPQNLKTADGSAATFLAPFDQINLEFTGTHTLLVDSWNAAGSGINPETGSNRRRSVWNQVKTLAPFSYFEFLGDVGDIPLLGDLPIPRIGYGQDVVDVVPEDRLEPYPGGP